VLFDDKLDTVFRIECKDFRFERADEYHINEDDEKRTEDKYIKKS
jgi:hypothetical protein